MSKRIDRAGMARALNVDPSTVSRYRQRGDWPVGMGPWSERDVAKARAWQQTLQEDRGGGETRGTAIERAARLRLIRARVAMLEAEIANITEHFTLRSEVERDHAEKAAAVREAIEGGVPVLMAKLAPGMTPSATQDVVNTWAKAICDRFAGEDTEAA